MITKSQQIKQGDIISIQRGSQGLGMLIESGTYTVTGTSGDCIFYTGDHGLPVSINLSQALVQGLEIKKEER